MGTLFATRVPVHLVPAGTRVPVYQMSSSWAQNGYPGSKIYYPIPWVLLLPGGTRVPIYSSNIGFFRTSIFRFSSRVYVDCTIPQTSKIPGLNPIQVIELELHITATYQCFCPIWETSVVYIIWTILSQTILSLAWVRTWTLGATAPFPTF